MKKVYRVLVDIFWILLIIIVPWFIFRKFFLDSCYNAIRKRDYASYDMM